MIRIGVTGGIGAGKSSVCKILEIAGIPVFYADDVGREILDSEPTKQMVVKEFGVPVHDNGSIDRKALAEIVFNSESALERLSAIIHPLVRDSFERWCNTRRKEPIVAQEAAVLIESGGYKNLDHIVVVTAPEQLRIARVMQRDNASENEVRSRVEKQLNDQERQQYADTIVVNDDKTLVIPQVLSLVEDLKLS